MIRSFFCLLILLPVTFSFNATREEKRVFKKILSISDALSRMSPDLSSEEQANYENGLQIAFDLERPFEERVADLSQLIREMKSEKSSDMVASILVGYSKELEKLIPLVGKRNIRFILETVLGPEFLAKTKEEKKRVFWKIVNEMEQK